MATIAVMSCARTSVDWPVHGGNVEEHRFSTASQIDRGNVAQLGLAWSFEFDSNRGQEATPIMIDGVIYVSTAWSRVYALDARSGRQLWRFDPEVPGSIGFVACCDVVNRGVAVSAGRVFVGTLDGRLIALDAKTGSPVWTVQTTDRGKPSTITGAPRVAGDSVVIGNGGAEFGVRGYVTAYAAATGKQLWRFYTVPGDPGAPPDGAVSDTILKEVALPTWAGRWYEFGGGGTVWDAIVYDRQLDQLYIGVGNGSPWNHKIRSDGKGDNLFLSSIVALDPKTGAYRWHYQQTPGESWDFTATQPIVLADLKIDGRDRKVIMQAPKNGFFYVIDRTDGKLISAENYVPTTWATSIDPKSGRPVENPAARYRDKPFVMLPSALGGHSWHPMAYSPQTGLVYLPTHHFGMMYGQDPRFVFRPGYYNPGISDELQVPPDDIAELKRATTSFEGRTVAWDPVAQREVWSVRHASVQNGGILATAGGLIFQGTGTGEFQARDARNGRLLWSFDARNGIMAGPISYDLDGVQYVAVMAGYGGAYGLAEPADKTMARPNGRLLVFKLDGSAKLPPTPEWNRPFLLVDAEFSNREIDQGRLLYTANCSRCHGGGALSGGVLPDLRRSAALGDRDLWHSIVLDGALESTGMVGLAKWLRPEDAENIRAYVAHKAKLAERRTGQSDRPNGGH
jgi:quinohemoprotein ethanol dehydrogenase